MNENEKLNEVDGNERIWGGGINFLWLRGIAALAKCQRSTKLEKGTCTKYSIIQEEYNHLNITV